MESMVEIRLVVKTEGQVNLNEIAHAAEEIGSELKIRLVRTAIQERERELIDALCSVDWTEETEVAGRHTVKGADVACGSREFQRAGFWSRVRIIRTDIGVVRFFPAMVRCRQCGKRLTPILSALRLRRRQRHSDSLVRLVTEAVADTSYRRGVSQLEALAATPVARSSAHRLATSVNFPVLESTAPFIGADGTAFKGNGRRRGEVRLVLDIGEGGQLKPVGAWAGASWDAIGNDVEAARSGQARLLLADGEVALNKELGRLAERTQRCTWHFPRESNYALWKDGSLHYFRKDIGGDLRNLVAIEIPEGDLEPVGLEEELRIRDKIALAEADLDDLEQHLVERGYRYAATYIRRAKHDLFNYLRFWLDTGIAAPRTTSVVESVICELARRLKRVGWNWSDAGAERMARIVLIRRYAKAEWEQYWRRRLDLKGRCSITICTFTSTAT